MEDASEPADAPEPGVLRPALDAPATPDVTAPPDLLPPTDVDRAPIDSLALALRELPEDRQELTLALGARTHRCCYWGADTSSVSTRDGAPVVTWVGPDVPSFIPPVRDGQTLNILDPHDIGWLAFYRELYGDPGCHAADGDSRCEYSAAMFDPDGRERWHVALDRLFSRPDVEIDDLHFHEGMLYFNEACPITSEKGHCGALVAYDPVTRRVLWRSKPHVSDDAFRIVGDRIVAVESIPKMTAPGGTGSLTVLDRITGRTLARRSFSAMIDEVVVDDNSIMVDSREGRSFFRMRASKGRLQLVEIPQPVGFAPRTVSLYR